MTLHARLVGTAPSQRRRWWQFVPPWCIARPAGRVRWASPPIPLIMGGERDRESFPLRNTSTLVWSTVGWPSGVEVGRVHIEDDYGVLLFRIPLDHRLPRLSPGDTVQVPVGGITLSID